MTKRVLKPLTPLQFERAVSKLPGKTSAKVTNALHEYLVRGKPLHECARLFECSPSAMYTRLKAMGLDVGVLTTKEDGRKRRAR